MLAGRQPGGEAGEPDSQAVPGGEAAVGEASEPGSQAARLLSARLANQVLLLLPLLLPGKAGPSSGLESSSHQPNRSRTARMLVFLSRPYTDSYMSCWTKFPEADPLQNHTFKLVKYVQ